MSVERDCDKYLICDDLNVKNSTPISKEMLSKIPKVEGKVIHGTFGKFSIADYNRFFQRRQELNEH
jgi:hypothetical protein|nr:MAG TPA: hypothetical protein [Caudoviricetes sp.]